MEEEEAEEAEAFDLADLIETGREAKGEWYEGCLTETWTGEGTLMLSEICRSEASEVWEGERTCSCT
jgi:hypothetical protein